jgi:hypothetical protein
MHVAAMDTVYYHKGVSSKVQFLQTTPTLGHLAFVDFAPVTVSYLTNIIYISLLHIDKVSVRCLVSFNPMSFQTRPSAMVILTKLHHDLLLYLCDFLDAASILNFSLTCKRFHQLINENEAYWKLRYYKEFALDEDWCEGAWLEWHNEQTTPKQSTSTSQSLKTLGQKATRDWSHVNWSKAYYRRQMIYKHLINGSWSKRYWDIPVDDPDKELLCISGMSPRATVISKNDRTRNWLVRHDIGLPGLKPGQLAWSELLLPTDTIGEITKILDIGVSNRHVVMECTINKSSNSDKPSSGEIYKRNAIIAWDIQNISKVVPLYIQRDDEANARAYLTRLSFCGDWILGLIYLSHHRFRDTSHRYFIYDFKRASHYSFGSVYTFSHAHIQSATEDYAQVIVLHFNLDDMEVWDEDFTMTNDKPSGLRIHWQSYIFDDEHEVSLEDHSGEIIIPYCNAPTIYGESYGPGLMMVIIYDDIEPEIHGDTEPHDMLALVRVPDHSLPQTSISRRRRSRFDGAVGEVIWIQPIASSLVLPLYSQNLIVVNQFGKIDILSGIDGKIVRQFDLAINGIGILKPIIGPYCYLRVRDNGLIVNVETGETFRHNNAPRLSEERHSPTFVGDAHTTGGDGTTSEMVTTDEVDVVDFDLPFTSDDDFNFSFTLDDELPYHLLSGKTVMSPITSGQWPFCNCIGQITRHEPGHRNRFYLYSLFGF